MEFLEQELFALYTTFMLLCVPVALITAWRLRVRNRIRRERDEMRRRNKIYSEWLTSTSRDAKPDQAPDGMV